MFLYFYDQDDGGPNDNTVQVRAVDDAADTIWTDSGGLVPHVGNGVAYIGYYSYFIVRLTSQPSASVTIRVQSGDSSEGVISPTSLTFTPANWNTSQYVYVYPVDDQDDEGAGSAGDQLYSVVFIPPTASEALDPAYVGVSHAPVSVNNVDDDEVGVVVSVSNLVIQEGGNKDGYTIRLASRPQKDVQIDVASALGQVAIDPATLVFTPGDWFQPQTVKISALDDVFVEGNHGDSLTYVLQSVDPMYDGLAVASSPTIDIADNAVADLEVIPNTTLVNRLVVAEEDVAGTTINVRLTASPPPMQEVHLDVVVDNWPGTAPETPTLSGTVPLVFTAANWNQFQTVTVHVPNDANGASENFRVVFTADPVPTTTLFDAVAATVFCRTQDNDTVAATASNS